MTASQELAFLAHELAFVIKPIQDSATTAFDAWHSNEPYTQDLGIFGYTFWASLNNHFQSLCATGAVPMVKDPKQSGYLFRGRTLRFHRASPGELVPRCAVAAKRNARVGVPHGPNLFGEDPTAELGTGLIVISVLSPTAGLKQILIGELLKHSDREAYYFRYQPAIIYNANGDLNGGIEIEIEPVSPITPVVTYTPPQPDLGYLVSGNS